MSSLKALRARPAGKVRINSVEHASQAILWPSLRGVMAEYPDIEIEIIDDYRLVGIVAGRFDAGVRLEQQVDQDMTALRIGPDFRQVIVCAPGYVAARGLPQVPQDLLAHDAVMLRLPRSGGLYPWSFARDGQELTVRPKGRGIFNTVALLQQAAMDGLGFVSLPEDLVAGLIAEEHLVRMLADWSLLRPGYHLYCPSRRQPSPAFAIVLEALRRFRG